MRFLNYPLRHLFMALLPVLVISSCRPKIRKIKSPEHYNFSRHEEFKLDIAIREISGIAWDSKDDVFVAVNDEFGKLYFLTEDKKAIIPDPYPFAGRGDYEDVVVVAGVLFVLRSDGQITQFLKDSTGKGYKIKSEEINIPGSNDFETLYYDAERKALIMVCKNCAMDENKSVSAFAYYPDSIGFDSSPVFAIDVNDVAKLSPFKASRFQPSAAAIHPILHKLFILSSASRQLVVADLNGKPEAVYELGRKLFPQPEGITFRKDGTMCISNESMSSKATVLQFSYDSASGTATKTGAGPYNFTSPDEKMELGKHLHEISGMAYIPDKDMMLAENDEKGDIFTLDYKNKNDKVNKIKFGGKGDYEDIVYTDTAIYMLVSTGGVVQVDTRDSSFTTKEFILPGEKNEFEALYLDAEKKSLIMLCKECAHEKDEIRAAYRFDLATNTFDAAPAYTIDIAEIQKMLNDDKAEFKPSAAGINPVNGKLYIIASVGKLLVIADKNTGKPEQVLRLDPVMYNQPEGMTFAPNGDLYISNEGGEGIATILKFVYKK
jgi:uncharacterized protein YjiK